MVKRSKFDSICKDCLLLILNYLSIESARALGLTCSKFYIIYQKYVSCHPLLTHFKDILIKIQQKEEKELKTKENFERFITRKIPKNPGKNFYPDFRQTQAGRGILIPRAASQNSRIISKKNADIAYNLYLVQLDQIIFNTQQNREFYHSLPLPAFIKYLISIWMKYPSKYIRLVPFEILKQYLEDCEALNADYCLLFKTTQQCCLKPHISDDENIWNLKDKMIDLDEVIFAFSRTKEESFLFGLFDLENRGDPPLTICHNCPQSPCSFKCKYYYIDYENRFPESGIQKGKISDIGDNLSNGYYQGTFFEVFNYFVKNRYLLVET